VRNRQEIKLEFQKKRIVGRKMSILGFLLREKHPAILLGIYWGRGTSWLKEWKNAFILKVQLKNTP